MTESNIVQTELSEHVLTITMNRPEARNALSAGMMAALQSAFRQLAEDDDCYVAVLQAEGPSFCAGADLKEALAARSGGAEAPPRDADAEDGAGPPTGRTGVMSRRPKPVIACVEGHAYAGGLELLMTCDLIVASSEAKFALSEVKRGLLAIGGGLFRLPRRLPHAIAMEMILTGDPVPAEFLHQYGLVNEVTAPGQARAAARVLAQRIAANSPVAVQAALEVASKAIGESWTDDEGFEGQKEPLARVQSSEDLIEGLKAFVEKRPAVWKAR